MNEPGTKASSPLISNGGATSGLYPPPDSNPFPELHHSIQLIDDSPSIRSMAAPVELTEENEAERLLASPPDVTSTTNNVIESNLLQIQVSPTGTPSVSHRDSEGPVARPKWKQFMLPTLLFGAAIVVVSATIWVSFRSSAAHPMTLFNKPQNTILALSIGSTISVFLIGELLAGTYDILRWTLAARSSGIGLASFLALGRATGSYGVLRLLFSNQEVGHRKWCTQRLYPLKA